MPSLPPGPRGRGLAHAVLWSLRYPQFTTAAHRRFGPTFTIKPGTMQPLVLTTDADAIRRLFTGDPRGKRHGNDVLRPLIGERSVLLLEPDEHLARRRLLLPPFHGERVEGYAKLMQSLIDREVERWRPGDSVAMLPVAQNLTIEVILQTVLGVADRHMRRRLRQLIDDILFYPLGPLYRRLGERPAPRWSPPARVRELAAVAASLPTPAVATYFEGMKKRTRLNPATLHWWTQRDELMALLDDQIAATRADPRLAKRDDILAMLVQARDEHGEGLGTEDLHDDLLALIGAGHETTAAAIAWGVALLAHNPDVRERATEAARAGDEAYLGALVKEVLRLRPPLTVAAGRVVREPFPIGSHTLPPGTWLAVDAWGVHHDPARYPDPDAFRPERFLNGGPSEPYTWLPFGGGAHRCIGSGLAELEVRVALGSILRRVGVAPADRELAPASRRGVTLVPHGGGRFRVS